MSFKNLVFLFIILPKFLEITSGVFVNKTRVNFRVGEDPFILVAAGNFPVIEEAKTDGILRTIEGAAHAESTPFSHGNFSIFIDKGGGGAILNTTQTLKAFLYIHAN